MRFLAALGGLAARKGSKGRTGTELGAGCEMDGGGCSSQEETRKGARGFSRVFALRASRTFAYFRGFSRLALRGFLAAAKTREQV